MFPIVPNGRLAETHEYGGEGGGGVELRTLLQASLAVRQATNRQVGNVFVRIGESKAALLSFACDPSVCGTKLLLGQ